MLPLSDSDLPRLWHIRITGVEVGGATAAAPQKEAPTEAEAVAPVAEALPPTAAAAAAVAVAEAAMAVAACGGDGAEAGRIVGS